jgi:hypothetical protein
MRSSRCHPYFICVPSEAKESFRHRRSWHLVLLAVHGNAITTNAKNGAAKVFGSTFESMTRSHTEEAGSAAV